MSKGGRTLDVWQGSLASIDNRTEMSSQEPFRTYSPVTLPLTAQQRAAIAAATGTHPDNIASDIEVFLQMDGTFDCDHPVASTWELDAPGLGPIRVTLNADWTYDLVSLAV